MSNSWYTLPYVVIVIILKGLVGSELCSDVSSWLIVFTLLYVGRLAFLYPYIGQVKAKCAVEPAEVPA
ncbi:hypothetical protein [Vibrio sp. HN007]|uniref:hypothetical protein n=1 Tax=Vibrio iocasae TaxID=3098914 RepID=UPI0035D44179